MNQDEESVETRHLPARQRATINDVAARAGVSRASVSRVLLGQKKVSQDTRAKVRLAAAELGYVPSVAAATLASGGGDTLGLLLRDAANPTYGLLFTELERSARVAGRQVVSMTVTSDEHGRDQLSALHHLVGLGVAGLIVATGGLGGDQLRPFTQLLPIVRVGRPVTSTDIQAVSYDEWAGGREVAQAVLAAGHRRVLVLVTESAHSHPEFVRGTAMAQELRRGGAEVIETMVRDRSDTAGGCDLAARGAISAVLCPSDTRALEVLRAARSAGIRVPHQLSVTGFDGVLPGADLLGLATYRIAVEEVAARGVATLVESITGSPQIRQVAVPGRFVPGETLATWQPTASAAPSDNAQEAR